MAWIVIKKADLSIIAMSGASSDMIQGGTTYNPILADFCTEKSLVEADHYKIDHTNLDIIRYGANIVDNGDGTYSATAKSAPVPQPNKKVVLSSDALDSNPANGIKEIPADGTSTCTLSAQLMVESSAGSGSYINDETVGINISFKTTGGALSARVVASDATGLSTVTLKSSLETVEISLSASAPGYVMGSIPMEFAPV